MRLSRRRPPRTSIDRPAGPINPFELYLLAVCAIQGVAVLLRVVRPASIETALSPPAGLRVMWAILLIVGGVAGTAGLLWADPFTGVEIKRIGLIAAGFGTLAYGAALIAFGPQGWFAAGFNLAFAAACAVRTIQVTSRLTAARTQVAHLRTHTPRSGGHG